MNTKETIVILGDEMLRMRGYNAFSYADISKRLGIKNAAVHYHFPSKADLGIAIIEHHIKALEALKIQQKELSPLERINTFVGIYEKIHKEGKVCLVGALATDWDTLDESLKERLQYFSTIFLKWLMSALSEGVDKGDFRFTETVEVKALTMITGMLAATQLARVTGSQSFQTIKSEIIRNLKA